MRTRVVFLLWVLAGCTPGEAPPHSPDVTLPPPTANAVQLPVGQGGGTTGAYVGAYQGSLGLIWFERADGQLVGHAAGTTLRCIGTADLDCTWKDESGHGWAKLRPEGTGDLRGDWGEQGTTTASGTWIFFRAGDSGDEHFEGEYDSDYGDVKLVQHGHDVEGPYQTGTLTCVAQGPHLDCLWTEPGSNGHAMLSRQPNGNIVGTWGNGTSYTDGGPWVFHRK